MRRVFAVTKGFDFLVVRSVSHAQAVTEVHRHPLVAPITGNGYEDPAGDKDAKEEQDALGHHAKGQKIPRVFGPGCETSGWVVPHIAHHWEVLLGGEVLSRGTKVQ